MKIPVSSDIYLCRGEGYQGGRGSQVKYSGLQHPACRHISCLRRQEGGAIISLRRSGGRGGKEGIDRGWNKGKEEEEEEEEEECM